MGFSYDYSRIINELNEEIRDGILTPKSFIQILREDHPVFEMYRPIIDWYYDDKMTKENFAPDIFDSEDESREKKFLEFIYNKDKEKLEQITVEKCLYELEQMNTLIKKQTTYYLLPRHTFKGACRPQLKKGTI